MSDTEELEEAEAQEEEEEIVEESTSDAGEAEGVDSTEGEKENPLEMTDEDFEKLNYSEFAGEATVETEEDPAEVKTEKTAEVETQAQDTKAETAEKETETNYKAEYEKLLSPFKANGKDIQVDNVDDALALMQMGANYNKKMASLKPNLKLLKMLENNELLDEAKLSYLIELNKKDPDAIQKLLKDSKFDPLEVDLDEEKEYQPKSHAVSEEEVDLDTVLGEIKSTPTYAKTINAISNDWDDKSKQILVDTPEIIRTINDHVASGVYDQITSVIEKERMLGRLGGLSDIEAYKQVGEVIQARGGFNPVSEQESEQSPAANVQIKPKVNGTSNPKVKAQKRAASSTKSNAGSSKGKKDFNPLSMSDEEFEKISASKYM